MNLLERHARFAALHTEGCFLMPNPWDTGSARMMAALGAPALATSSAAHAFTLGRPDVGTLTRDEALSHAEILIAATPLPVSGDFENGFVDHPDEVAETIRLAGEVGLSGCSIEDTQMIDGYPPYARADAADRIAAATEAARGLGRPFILTARADGVMRGRYDLEEGIARLQAFERAGADCVYLPLLPDRAALTRVLAAVSAPLNVLAADSMHALGMQELGELGVRRVSLGSQMARVTHAAIHDAMCALLERGDLAVLKGAASAGKIDTLLAKSANAATDYPVS